MIPSVPALDIGPRISFGTFGVSGVGCWMLWSTPHLFGFHSCSASAAAPSAPLNTPSSEPVTIGAS